MSEHERYDWWLFGFVTGKFRFCVDYCMGGGFRMHSEEVWIFAYSNPGAAPFGGSRSIVPLVSLGTAYWQSLMCLIIISLALWYGLYCVVWKQTLLMNKMFWTVSYLCVQGLYIASWVGQPRTHFLSTGKMGKGQQYALCVVRAISVRIQLLWVYRSTCFCILLLFAFPFIRISAGKHYECIQSKW